MRALSTPPFDGATARLDFPLLRRRVRGRRLVYLDNAATTQKPRQVIDRLTRFYRHENANVHRGAHLLGAAASDACEDARETVRRFVNAKSAREVVFVRGTTEAVNLVAATFGRATVGQDDEILVSEMEHHSNLLPWQALCQEKGAHLRVIPVTDGGCLRMDALPSLVSTRTRLISVAHVSNVTGVVNPVEAIVRHANQRGIPVMVDGAQAAAHMAVDVQALGCQFYAFSGHKVFGPTGIGVLYAQSSLLDTMAPYQTGGGTIESVTFDGTTYADAPRRLEAGTPHIEGILGLAAALDYLSALGLDRVSAYEHDLVSYATERLLEVPGLRIIGGGGNLGMLSFVLDGVHPHDVATILDRDGIAIRAGHHCCQPLMARLGLPGTSRASFACYNVREDVDALCASLRAVRSVFG